MLIPYRRNRLKEESIEAIEYMKSWTTNGSGGAVPFKDCNQVRLMLEQLEAKGSSSTDRESRS